MYNKLVAVIFFFPAASLCSVVAGELGLTPLRCVEARLGGKERSMGLAHSLGLRGEALECSPGC